MTLQVLWSRRQPRGSGWARKAGEGFLAGDWSTTQVSDLRQGTVGCPMPSRIPQTTVRSAYTTSMAGSWIGGCR